MASSSKPKTVQGTDSHESYTDSKSKDPIISGKKKT